MNKNKILSFNIYNSQNRGKNMIKKLFITTLIISMCSAVYAENIYPYQNTTPINSPKCIIKTKNGTEYINLPSKRTFNPLTQVIAPGAVTLAAIPALLLDPYVIKIDGINYVLIKDRNDNNWSEKDLLGIDDPKENRFESLIKLNSDKDFSKITAEELKKANIRFVRMDSKGRLLVNERNKDYNLKKVDYIDIINLKRTANSDTTGIFGHFTVYIKTANNKTKAVVGYVTYETDKKIEVLFK